MPTRHFSIRTSAFTQEWYLSEPSVKELQNLMKQGKIQILSSNIPSVIPQVRLRRVGCT
uniref:Uncharacterized protein n=1 Tax=Solanum tuberosum TaxID=4113 RepID=M1A900_SOLTU